MTALINSVTNEKTFTNHEEGKKQYISYFPRKKRKEKKTNLLVKK